MRQLTLLNSLLLANTIILGGILWTQIAERPFAESAMAVPQSRPTQPVEPTRGGVPNAGLQRLEMLQELQRIRVILEQHGRLLEGLGKVFSSGSIKVEVNNVDDFATVIQQRPAAAPLDPPAVRRSNDATQSTTQ